MAIYNTPDGRQVVGSVESGNDYHGFNGKRDIIIQLTADGATADGLNALEYLKAYAVEQNRQNKPIFPNGTRVFISANGYTKAVEADDIVIDGDNIAIGGIKWDGSAWDYSEAGQTGGALPPITSADAGKVLTATDSGVWGAGVQEYWIPVTVSGSELSIPNDRQMEGGVIVGNVYYPGYVSNSYDFIVPLSKSFMQGLGFDCAGKIHIADNDGYKVSIEPDKFIVTLTPTSLDYSGTMDKTVAEINAAYEAGQEIWFKVMTGATTYMEVDCTARWEGGFTYPSYNGFIVSSENGGVLIYAFTNATDDGTKATYGAHVYTLTPAT